MEASRPPDSAPPAAQPYSSYMYAPATTNGSGLRGGQWPQNYQQHPQQLQEQREQPLKQEQQDQSPSAMIGRAPTGSGSTALVPLDKIDGEKSPADDLTNNGSASNEPASHSMIQLGRRYTLQVVQQPQRARMCGFGDKDRRPITPPPCIRLVIIDVATGVEVDTNDIEYGLFVLNVDLWSEDGKREVNLVRHSTASPAISSTVPTSYVQAQAGAQTVYINPLPTTTGGTEIIRSPQYPYHTYDSASNRQPPAQQFNPYIQQQPPSSNPYSNQNQYPQHQQRYTPQHQQQQPQYGQPPQQSYDQGQYQQQRRPSSKDFGGRPNEPPNHHLFYHTGSSVHAVAANAGRPNDHPISNPVGPQMNQWGEPMYGRAMQPAPTPQGMYTRNLIGSLSASAFRLSDPNDKIGIWFVLQDLSVRTEGNFRLRFSFCNVGMPSKTPNGNPANQISIVNTGKAPILASCYSDVFTVYSAKKFPGVVESTALSKCFATQGIKIPIRKDGAPKKGRGGMDDDDD